MELDCDNKTAANCSKNISFCEESVKISPPTDVNVKTDEADEDSILLGNDSTTIKSLEYSQTSINNSSQMIDDKGIKRKSSRLSFSHIGSLFNKFILKVSNTSSESSDLMSRKFENLSPECLELRPMIEQMLNQKLVLPHHVPGMTGLPNQGNTCYMNAVLQCLSNTDQLTAYFLSDIYKTRLKHNQSGRNCGRFSNISNFTHSTTTLNSGSEHTCGQEPSKKSISRSRGAVTEHLVCLIRNMWSGRSCGESLSRFKSLVGRMGKQFKGSTQQDAHEFFLWLINQLNEDLSFNCDAVKKKSSKNKGCTKGSNSLEDNSTVGSISPSIPSQATQSVIMDLFQAYYRSSLTCLKCEHRSYTFDPFLSISLSLLSSSSLSLGLRHPIYVVVVYLSATPKQVRIGLQMKHGCTIKDLRDTVSNDTNIPREQLVLADVRMDGHVTTLFDNQPIEHFRNLSSIYAIEIPRANQADNHIVMVIVNKFENGVQYEKFGDPVVLLMHESCSFFDMQQDLLMEVKQYILVELDNNFFNKSFLDLRLVNLENRSECYYMSSDSFPLRSSMVSRALDRCASGPRHIMVIAEWYQMTRSNFSSSMNDSCVEHESVNVVRSAQYSPSCSLEDCFHVYTQKEQLGADNAWYCPSCNKKQVETSKKLTLWSLPRILVVHLKRFKHDSSQRSKLDTFVTFPTRDLDLSSYLSRASRSCIPSAIKASTNQSSMVFSDKGPLIAKISDGSNEASDLVCAQNIQSSYKVTNLSKLKAHENVSNDSSLDCPPIVMKSIPNDKVSYPILASNHMLSSRRLSNGSAQNEVKSKSLAANHSPSFIDPSLQAGRGSCNASEVSLRDSHLNHNCEGCRTELYDLYAVCNHYGSLYEGHYTAYCRNPMNNNWYIFNDTQVSPIREEEVVTKHAYLLFYKKKTISSSCQPHCALATNREMVDESTLILRDEGKETPLKDAATIQPSDQLTMPPTDPNTKWRPSLFSKIRRSLFRGHRRSQSSSHKNDHTKKSAPEEKDTMLPQGQIGETTTSDTSPRPGRSKHLSGQTGTPPDKCKRRTKSFHGTRNIFDCTRLCILSSNESVVCSDIQLAQLHALQESRV